MSEYQYYSFRAVDRPLGSSEMQHLRNISSRLVDLRDAYALQGSSETFHREFQQFMTEHRRRKALVTRLDKAGLR